MASEFIVREEGSRNASLNLIEKSILMSQYDKLVNGLSEQKEDVTVNAALFTKSKLENQPWGKHPSGVLKLANLLRHNQLCCVVSLTLASCDLETLPDMSTMRRTLRKLDVRGNRMSVLPDLRGLSGLEELSIQGNPIPMLPGWLAEMPFILKFEAGSPHTVAISNRIIERIGYDKRYKVIISEQYRINLVSPPHFVLYQFKLSGGAKEITMKTAKEVMKMVKDGDIQLQEEVEEKPPDMVKEPREKIKFKSLEEKRITESPETKKIKQDQKSKAKEKNDTEITKAYEDDPDSNRQNEDEDCSSDSESTSSVAQSAENQSTQMTEEADSKNPDDMFDDLDFDCIDQTELAELLDIDENEAEEPSDKAKTKGTKRKEKQKSKRQDSESSQSTEKSVDIDDNLCLDDLGDLSVDMQAELAELLELDVDVEDVLKHEKQQQNKKKSPGSKVNSGNSKEKGKGDSSSSDSEDKHTPPKSIHQKTHSERNEAKSPTCFSSSTSGENSDSSSESDSISKETQARKDGGNSLAGMKSKKGLNTKDAQDKRLTEKERGTKFLREHNSKTRKNVIADESKGSSGNESSSSSETSESENDSEKKTETIDADDIIANIKSRSAQRAKELAERKKEEAEAKQRLEKNQTEDKNKLFIEKRTKDSFQKGANRTDTTDAADETRKKKLASLKENLASLKKEQEDVRSKRFTDPADKAKQEELRQNLESTRKELDALKISMASKKSQLDKAIELEKEEEEARKIEHQNTTKKTREKRLKETQEKLKARQRKEEAESEIPSPPPPPPPVPIVTVDDSAPETSKLPFTAADLAKGKNRLSNPSSKSRSVSPAVAKNMKKDLIGDLKDVLELRKKRGDGAGDRSMKPSMVKYSDKSLAGRSPSKSPLPRSKFPK